MKQQTITVTVNKKVHTIDVEARITLADFLRHKLALTGTHLGCEHGVCGACTVLMDGRSIRSCLTLAIQTDGHSIQTIEGLASSDGELSALQRAFIENHGLQCGFCTPGMLMTLQELLSEGGTITEEIIRDRISGNICRCTGYQAIVDAALAAADLIETPTAQE